MAFRSRCRDLCLVSLLTISLGYSQSSNLQFDDLFPRKSFYGRTAMAMKWSPDDRYLAYLWNGYDDMGSDIWIYDSKEHKTRRITSTETFKPFDPTIVKAIEQKKKDVEEDKKVEKMTDLEWREWTIERRKTPPPPKVTYSGVSEFNWANKSDEMLLVYKGDIYRLSMKDGKLTRMTETRDGEMDVRFIKDDTGFTFRRGDGIYQMKFDSSMIKQLNPVLPDGFGFGGYVLSPDESKMLIVANKSNGRSRTVDYISYRERFAQAQKAERDVSEDKFNGEEALFLVDLKDSEKKPWELWRFKGGNELEGLSLDDKPWTPDSQQVVFASWKRNVHSVDVQIADVKTQKVRTVFATKEDGEHTSNTLANPMWTPDGKKIVTLLETSGFRHAWVIDPLKDGADQLTKGDFEVYPLEMTKDGKELLVLSHKENPAYMDIYRVDMQTGAMKRLTKLDGNYGVPVFSHSQDHAATTFKNWTHLNELYVLNSKTGGDETQLTESHKLSVFKKMNIKQPQLFSYPNRNGQTVHGFMFLPDGWKKEDKHPVMVYVYGGPLGKDKSVTAGDFNSTAYWFNLYLTQKYGFVTVTIDPRGGSAYGAAFGKANWENPGVAQVEDLSDGVKYLEANYGVDRKKVAVNGWSFGGFQTQMCMYTAPDVFTLGIAGAGPTEWQNYNNWYSGGVIGDPKTLDKYSLTYKAKGLQSPLLLLHGMEDTNVLYQDTVKVYQKLLQYGKGYLVDLALDPTGGHGMGGDMSNHDRHRIYLEFIKTRWRLEP